MDPWVPLAPHAVAPHEPWQQRVRDALGTFKRGDLVGHLELAAELGPAAPRPAGGATRGLWELLATLGAHDLQLARAVEPHLDALAILDEAGSGAPTGSAWGVFAAEGPGARLTARPAGEGWVLEGTKPWCSLAAHLSHALVTAWVDDETRGLFALDLRGPGVRTAGSDGSWVPRGLPDIVSTAIEVDGAGATPVGGPGWYLRRDGFAWGGIGVAAVWYGGAVGLARRLARPAGRPLDQVGHLHLGLVDQHLTAARATLAEAAALVDAGAVSGHEAAALATRVRSVVAAAAEGVLASCEHALGPGPQVGDAAYAAGLADLRLYLRQHHAERDLAALGRGSDEHGAWWSR
ncbi:MAG: acyl-CoA dehydrogenase [Nocardioides marinisabuli]|uniref:acyl-CoA dehydrogenase n=1 Tax=Nocardioides marinisabuli TaxID=419476 RepID=UPI00321AFEDF